jgi:hypothetical protein
VEKIEVGEKKIVEGGPSTPPHREMPPMNATWYERVRAHARTAASVPAFAAGVKFG